MVVLVDSQAELWSCRKANPVTYRRCPASRKVHLTSPSLVLQLAVASEPIAETHDGAGLPVRPDQICRCRRVDTVIAASGLLAVIPSVQRISLGPGRGGQRAHLWVDEYTVHILIDGELVKTVPSNVSPDDLRDLSMRGARPAGPPPATASVARAGTLPAVTVIEVDRIVDITATPKSLSTA